MTAYNWVAVSALTGNVVGDVPNLYVTGSPITQTIGRYETATAQIPISADAAPAGWSDWLIEGSVNLILLADGAPVWGAMVVDVVPDHTDTLTIALATMEAYFDRRFVGNQTYTATGQNDIVSSLITNYVAAGVNGGIPIRVQYVTAGSGTPRDRTYADQDDKTVYSALTDLMGVQGGPEWFVGWEHQTGPERYTPVLYVGDRIGTAAASGMQPNAWFEMPGAVNSFSFERDYTAGKGANSVVATSSGQGTTRPQSGPQVVSDPNRPTFEYRFTPSTSIIDTSTLTAWASSAVAQMSRGVRTLKLTAVATDPACPQLGSDWGLGDDIGYKIGGLDANGLDTVPAFPGGISGVARAISYQLDIDGPTPIITPVLVGPAI